MTQSPHMPHRYIAIEGPIAVGKTTLCNKLSQNFGGRTVLEEFDDNPFLKDFYRDPKAVAFQTQIYFLFARYRQQHLLRQQDLFLPVLVSDYLFDKDRIFAYLNLSPNEVKLYEKIYDLIRPDILKPDLVIYLQAKPQVLMERLRKRGRPMESEVDQEYLEKLIASYNNFFHRYKEAPLITLDTSNIDLANDHVDFERLLSTIQNKVKNKHI